MPLDEIVNGFTIQKMIEEAERELKMRRYVFPNMVQRRKMSQDVADYQMGAMTAIRDYLISKKVELDP